MNPLVFIANVVGGLVFFWIDKWIFNRAFMPAIGIEEKKKSLYVNKQLNKAYAIKPVSEEAKTNNNN